MNLFSFSTEVSCEVILTLDEEYNNALDDPGTTEYEELKNNIETLVSEMQPIQCSR